MNIFGRTSFIISLAFTLLISGITLFYYVNRFKHLEKNIIEQGKILQSFIIKTENQKYNLASSIALDSAKQQISKMSKNNKIEVSDDDNDECQEDTNKNIKICKKKSSNHDLEDSDEDDEDDEDEDEEDDDEDEDEEDEDEDDEDEDDEDEDEEDEKKSRPTKNKECFLMNCGECDITKTISQEYLNTIFCLNIEAIDPADTFKKININETADVIDISNMTEIIDVSSPTSDSKTPIVAEITEESDMTDMTDMTEKELKSDIKNIPTTETLIKNKGLPSQQKKINLSRLKLQELRTMVLSKHPEIKDLTTIKKEELIKLLNEN